LKYKQWYRKTKTDFSLFKMMVFREWLQKSYMGEGFPVAKHALPQETVLISLRSKGVSFFSSLLGKAS
jgi:hypothetical protein